MNKLRRLINPSWFQGVGKTKNYFEGWYFKIVNADESKAFAIIPGIALDKKGDGHAFIQVLDGKLKTSKYHPFALTKFVASDDRFFVEIEKNSFSDQKIQLALLGIEGLLSFSQNIPWPDKWYAPGIMGPYTFAPFMECYHGIVSMHHSIQGSLNIDGVSVGFDGGKGYIEKDWGRSFPEAYIWLQTNHFTDPKLSLKVSVARIPWIRHAFTGFIAGLWINDQLIQFTTYNGSELLKCRIKAEEVLLILKNKTHLLEIIVKADEATSLSSPLFGSMTGKIEESMSSLAEVRLTHLKSNNVILHDYGRNACLEVAGKTELIQK